MNFGTVVATRFERVLDEGRTKPLVLNCIDARNPSGMKSYVCKAFGCPEVHSAWQLVTEVVGNATARNCGVITPAPAIVEISRQTATIINKSLEYNNYEYRIEAGYAAGCEFIGGMAPLGPGLRLNPNQFVQARNLFVFDMLAQNPDRRPEKVNCGLLGGQIIAFDFELCFSHCFLPVIGSSQSDPVAVSGTNLPKSHLFYGNLRGEDHDTTQIQEFVSPITEDWLSEIENSLPNHWRGCCESICAHLRVVKERASDFSFDITQRCLI